MCVIFLVFYLIFWNIIMPPHPTIAALSNGEGLTLYGGNTFYIGPNTSVENDTIGITTTLPITTQNVLTSQAGLNINSGSGSSKLTIQSNGDLFTDGTIYSIGSISAVSSLNASSINIGSTNNFTVSNTGLTTLQDNLVVGSNFSVTKSSGDVQVGGTINSTGTVTIGGTISSPNLTLGNDGHITALNNLTIGNSDIVLNYGSGNASFKGDLTVDQSLNVNAKQLFIDSVLNVAEINCAANILGNLNINFGNFTVGASDGSIVSKGYLSVIKDVSIGAASQVVIAAATGNMTSVGSIDIASSKIILSSADGSISAVGGLKIGSDFSHPNLNIDASTGYVKTVFPYSSYVPPSSSDNVLTTTASGEAVSFVSETSQLLATQTYVDRQLWKQSVRINTILGTDSTVLDSFNNVYKLVQAMEGDTTASATLSGIVNESTRIVESVSTVVANSYNTVLINCAQSVWSNETSPFPIPYTLTSLPTFGSIDGWWFKNMAALSKADWFMPPNGSSMTMANFMNIYMNLFVASVGSLPFISVYTQPKGSNDLIPGFANARVNYLFNAPIANTYYSFYTGSSAPMNSFKITPVQCTTTVTTNNSTESVLSGNEYDITIVDPADLIMCFCINTDSQAPLGSVEFILNSFNIQQTSGTMQMLFQNSSVASNYMYNSLFKKNHDFSEMSLKNQAAHAAYTSQYNV